MSTAAQQKQSPPKKDEQPIEIQRLNEFSRVVSPKIFEAKKSENALTVLEALRALAVEKTVINFLIELAQNSVD